MGQAFRTGRWAAVVVLLGVGCGLPTEPADVFDDYVEAYALGRAEVLWDLSSPAARDDAKRIKAELMAGLRHPDAAIRLDYEGTFATTAEEIEPMDEKTFFTWAVATIRRRLGGGYVRSALSRWVRVRMESLPDGRIVVVYRWGERLGRMPLARVDSAWRVDQSPFPAKPAAPPKSGDDPLPPPEVHKVTPYDGGKDPAW